MLSRDPDTSTEAGTSTSLLWRAKNHDQVAWDRLVTLYAPTIFSWCRRAGLQDADACDVGQEVFRAVARNIESFDRAHGPGSFRGWLRTIVRTKVIDFFRRATSQWPADGGSNNQELIQAVPDLNLAESDPSEVKDKGEILQRAMELIQGDFEEATWKAFWWTTVEGRATQDVAAELGISTNAVYISKSRVLRRLREEFAELIEW